MAEKKKSLKKRTVSETVPNDDSSSSEDDDEYSGGIKMTSDNNDKNEKLEVLFEFRDPNESYYNAVSSLLTTFPCATGIDRSQLTDEITTQPEVGTLVCQEEGTDVFAFLTALNLGTHRDIQCLDKIKSYLLDKCPEDKKEELVLLLSDSESDVGFLLKAQMVNFPPQLVPAMHRSLCSDISWAFENAEGETEERNFNFKKLLFIAPFSESANEDGSKKGKKVKLDMTIFDYFDDELMSQTSKWSFQFQTASGSRYFVGLLTLKEYQESIAQMERML